jgi:hypothetical protein
MSEPNDIDIILKGMFNHLGVIPLVGIVCHPKDAQQFAPTSGKPAPLLFDERLERDHHEAVYCEEGWNRRVLEQQQWEKPKETETDDTPNG